MPPFSSIRFSSDLQTFWRQELSCDQQKKINCGKTEVTMEKPDLGQRLREAWKVFLFWRWERSFKGKGVIPSRSDWRGGGGCGGV